MSQILVIVAFILLNAPSVIDLGGSAPSAGIAAIGSVAPQCVLVAMVWLASTICGRSMDRRGSIRAAMLADRIARWARVASVALHGVACVLFAWPASVRASIGNVILLDEVIALAPVAISWLAILWAVEPIERRLREAVFMRALDDGRAVYPLRSRAATVWSVYRSTILVVLVPILMVIAASECAEAALARAGMNLDSERGQSVLGLTQLVAVLTVFLVAPFVLRYVWDAVPLGDGELRSALLQVAEQSRVRLRRLLVWRTGGTMINGAAVGILPGLRFVLLTDGLLDHLSLDQVRAVAAHEFGHIRRRHLPWLGVVMIACLFVFSAVISWMDEWMKVAAPSLAWSTQWVGGGAAVVLGLWCFGAVSRRFEWQADAFAVQTLSRAEVVVPEAASSGGVITQHAAEAMIGALDAVATLNGIPRRRRSWRHGSIYVRQMRLRAIVGKPIDDLPIDRECRRVNLGSVALFALAVLALFAIDWRSAA